MGGGPAARFAPPGAIFSAPNFRAFVFRCQNQVRRRLS
jgi:hypothetical protein